MASNRRPNRTRKSAVNATPESPGGGMEAGGRSQMLGLGAAAVVSLACMFNGRSALAMALLAGFTGLGLIVAPPRWRVPLPLLIAAGAILIMGLITLLPASWLSSNPAWKHSLATIWDLHVPPTVTPQPDLTVGAWLTTCIGCGWFFLLLGHAPSETVRRRVLRTLILGMLLITAIAIASRFQWISINWPVGYPPGKDDLGPFPNRNHFAGFCAIGAVLSAATAYDAFRKHSVVWVLFASGFLLFSTSIVLNTSRAGIGLLFIGITLWLATASMSKDFLRRIAIAASIILAAIAVLAFQKDGVGARLFDAQAGLLAEAGAYKGRTSIQLETAKLILDAPLTGVGLGQFDSVFAMEHRLPEHYVRFTHPESDWLWWGFETGLLILAALVFALGWLIKSQHFLNRKYVNDLRLRLAALIGLSLVLIHGMADVPLHNAGIAFLALLLAALTVAPNRLTSLASPLYRHAFRLVGVAVLCLGALLTLTAMGHPLYPGRMRLDAERALIRDLVDKGHYRDALDRITAQLQHTPLQWDLYYQAATLRLALRQPPTAALADFNRARALEPHNLDLCFEEGKVWLRHAPTFALIPWRECFNRSAARSHFFSMMLTAAQAYPEVLRDLRQLALTSPMKLTALAHTPPGEEWQALLTTLLQADPDLQQLEAAERKHLFHLWQSRGDRAQFVTAIEANPEWQPQAWQILADEYARASDFEKAWTVQKRFGLSAAHLAGQSTLSGDLQQLERNHLLNPNDLRRGVDLFFALKAAKRNPEAQRLLEKLMASPDSPDFLHQEMALIHAQNRDFRRAYETLKEALADRS